MFLLSFQPTILQLARYSTSSGAAAALPSRAATPTDEEIVKLKEDKEASDFQVDQRHQYT